MKLCFLVYVPCLPCFCCKQGQALRGKTWRIIYILLDYNLPFMFRPVVQRKNTYTFDWYCKCYEKHSYQSRYRTHAYTQTHTSAHDVSTCIDREHTCVSMCVCVCLCLPQNHTFSGDLLSNPQFHPDVTM